MDRLTNSGYKKRAICLYAYIIHNLDYANIRTNTSFGSIPPPLAVYLVYVHSIVILNLQNVKFYTACNRN